MNNVLDSITSNLNFYNPYFKQFKLHLQGKDIVILETIPSKANEYFQNEDYNVNCIDDLKEFEKVGNLDGIIINNFYHNDLSILLQDTYDKLTNNGIMLFIFNNQTYDKETINFLIKEKFILIEELIGDDKWNFILYSKKTTK